jgi:predicted esterase
MGNSVVLPSMNVNPNTIIVGGHSCGSSLANNMMLIESGEFSGAMLMNGFVVYGGAAGYADSFDASYPS